MRLMLAGILPAPPDIFVTILSALLMFGVYLQLLLYAAVVINRYTAIVHPSRHDWMWRLGKLYIFLLVLLALAALGACAFEVGNGYDRDTTNGNWKRKTVAISTFGISAAVLVVSLVLQTRTIIVYRRMSKQVRKQMKEEFLLVGYALLGLFMPIALSCIFGMKLFCSQCGDVMIAFPYLVDYMSLCEPFGVTEIVRKHVYMP
ncbi:hypothetical protein AAVH_14176 [Aphelenchoides avenae]|nr:hypothetical protein AAVH_14176 [Aphelenchus avenae]